MRTNETTPDYGKIPPQSRELEEAVLGAILLEQNAISEAMEVIRTADVFYVDANQRIWRAMASLYHENKQIDTLTVTERLKRHENLEAAGGIHYLITLTSKIGSAAHIGQHSRILVEKYILRKIITIGTNAITQAFNDSTDAIELLGFIGNQFDAVNMELSGQGEKTWSDSVIEEVDSMRAAAESGDYMLGVPTHSDVIDRNTLGLQPKNLIIIAGRPGMGKTSLAWDIALKQAKNGLPVGFFTLEMADKELIRKALSAELSMDTKTIQKGGLTRDKWQKLDSILPNLIEYPIYLCDSAGIGINELKAKARNWVRKFGVKVIYIDYIGKINTADTGQRYGTREQEVSYISGQLKNLAKSLNIPVVALSQLSRAVETRGGDKRPMLSDLRESGAIEQDADMVWFPYRPEYYGITTGESGEMLPEGFTEVDIAKYRNGNPGKVQLIFEAEFNRFIDYKHTEPWEQSA